MELFWILFGLGYGAYRNVKDQLPIKKVEPLTTTTFSGFVGVALYLSIMSFSLLIASICEIIGYRTELDFIMIIALIFAIAGLVWILFGFTTSIKYAQRIENRINIISQTDGTDYKASVCCVLTVISLMIIVGAIYCAVIVNQLLKF